MNKKKGMIVHLICSALIGIFFFIIGQTVYPYIIENHWMPLGIAIYFLIFSLIIVISNFFLCQIRHDYDYWYKNGKSDTFKKAYLRGLVCVLIIFILSGVFEFIYEIGEETLYDTTSYVFLIDDSGSMERNDPNNERGEAISRIMKNQAIEMPYAVYKFSEKAQLLKNMGEYTQKDEFEFLSDGNTNIVSSLDKIVDDLVSQKVSGGDYPKILILSDGKSSKSGVNSVIKKCQNNNIVVSTIGFNVNSGLLSKIARKTGGVYINIDNIDDLQEQMNRGITTSIDRNLISDRYVLHNDWLYALLRILFLSIIGIVFSFMKYEIFCSAEGSKFDVIVLRTSLICTFVASILMELCLNLLGISTWFIRLVFCVLWAVTPGYLIKSEKYIFRPEYQTEGISSTIIDENGYEDSLINKNELNTRVHTLNDIPSELSSEFSNNPMSNEDYEGFGFGYDGNISSDNSSKSSFLDNDEEGFGQNGCDGFGR